MNFPESYPKVKSKNPHFLELVKKKVEGQAFMDLLDMELVDVEEGKTTALLNVERKHQQQNGFLHGGVIATLADVAMGFAAFSLVPEDHHVVTGEIKISYLSPSTSKKVFSKGWVIKPGKKLHFCEAEIWEEREEGLKLIAKASSSMAVIFLKIFMLNNQTGLILVKQLDQI